MNGKRRSVEINIQQLLKLKIHKKARVGLAVLLVSLLILVQGPYEIFGTDIIWSILTVAMMFEYTVGSTFNRGFNRALGSLLAGILAIGVAQLVLRTGRVVEPIIVGISIFFIGAITSFMKLWPSFVPYEYGFPVLLYTYCLIIVSGYRMGNPIGTAMDRLYSIAIGGFVAVFVNVLVFPIRSGEQLLKELIDNFNLLAAALEECVKKYLEDEGLDHQEFTKAMLLDEFPDEPAYRKCQAISHVEFIGQIQVLVIETIFKFQNFIRLMQQNGSHHMVQHFFYPWSEYVKVGAVLRYCAYEVMALHGVFHSEIQEILDAANQAAELVRSLGKDICNMKRSLKVSLLKRVMRKQSRRLHSWPSREVDACGFSTDIVLPRMRALESTAALSLITFTSLLIEFVVRVDNLVEADDELSKIAKFKA
ncbi:hypothetical protein ES319_D03G095700v1 [Gossypium barbadense]|uniref:Aluminum-activated malate transporter n=2 Tax=Gossypium TaxID=3633 RepID=A0A5J5S1Z7_GOSBA|nr:hypothetical protein ES319_D03G095700v1 [Gossypium barbadense]TYG76293.1 hypothetical protein ES288_D03G103800v1 [Gossypium darwinii]